MCVCVWNSLYKMYQCEYQYITYLGSVIPSRCANTNISMCACASAILLLLFDSQLCALRFLVFGLWVLQPGPCMTDASNTHCLNISPRVSLLISVCHSY